ncbi:probable ATP-dependent RNA helicase DDX46 [Phlebotomus argentipes]|uniref:probable ATP-dependent RNA helicase DDX46 n=1 Tax=Phlebotomus argentipes TaxID=94469 RepID=UPI002893778C|nr:probable ATP-dependent RNA helicase DDX46 [Phlebotomus argentipes]
MSHEASDYRRSSGSRYRERDEKDSYRRSRHREDSRRSEKYHHHEERKGRYSYSSRRRSPSDDYRERRRDRSRDRYRYSVSRSRSRSRSRDYRRRRKDSYSPAENPPSPPKFSRADSRESSEDDALQSVEQRPGEFGERNSQAADDLSEEYFEDIEANKEKIHQAMEERLRQHLAAQGKVYPPPKPEPQQTTMFANDGSFMEMFKRMQEQQKTEQASGSGTSGVKKAPAPLFGKRRGGKILKTGIVEKKKPVEEATPAPGSADAWTLYMAEVKKYKNFSCDIDNNSRPLVK